MKDQSPRPCLSLHAQSNTVLSLPLLQARSPTLKSPSASRVIPCIPDTMCPHRVTVIISTRNPPPPRQTSLPTYSTLITHSQCNIRNQRPSSIGDLVQRSLKTSDDHRSPLRLMATIALLTNSQQNLWGSSPKETGTRKLTFDSLNYLQIRSFRVTEAG